MKDIENIGDIKSLVDDFYEKIRRDNLLAPIFASRITNWESHLDTMYRFWNAALFQVREYVGNPLLKHITLPVEVSHFERWIKLFYETVDQHFEGAKADEAKQRAMIMANTFYRRMHEHDVNS